MKIAIVGAGWLGLPLLRTLHADGHTLTASTTSPEKLPIIEASGASAYLAKLSVGTDWPAELLQGVELLIATIPPARQCGVETFYPQQIAYLSEKAQDAGVKTVLFISSTSVYPELNREVAETDAVPHSPTAEALLRAEKSWIQPLTVLRFGGLFGPDRHPARFMKHKAQVENGAAPVNLIHLTDCIGIIRGLIAAGMPEGIFNAVSPEHPSRAAFYAEACNLAGSAIPDFDSEFGTYKNVSPAKLISQIGYSFHYANPLEGLAHLG
jgi:nucleoside-diphosphate-sugar epimerase